MEYIDLHAIPNIAHKPSTQRWQKNGSSQSGGALAKKEVELNDLTGRLL